MKTSDLDKKLNEMAAEYNSLLDTESMMKKVLDEIAAERKKAEKSFSDAKREVLRLTSTTIDVSSYDLRSRISNVIQKATNSADNLSSTCMKLLTQLDTKCSMLYREDISADILKKIAEELHELNESSTINLDFGGSLNGISFGNVGTLKYEPDREALRIEARWEMLAETAKAKGGAKLLAKKYGIPEDVWEKQQKYENAKKLLTGAAKAYTCLRAKDIFKELGDFRNSSECVSECNKKFSELHKKEAEAEAAEKERLEQVKAHELEEKKEQAKKDAENKNLNVKALKNKAEKLNNRLEEEIRKAEKKNASDEKQIEEISAQRDALGLFKLGEKKELKQKIDMLKMQIMDSNAKLQSLKDSTENEKERINAAISIVSAKAGDEVVFGTQYYSHKTIPMEWLVSENTNGIIKLLAKHTVYKCRPFELDKDNPLNKSESYWLSQKFFNSVFTDEEQSVIDSVYRDGSSRKVFLPTEEEIRNADPTMIAKPEEAFSNFLCDFSSKNLASHYWVGGFSYNSMFISNVNYIDPTGKKCLNSGSSAKPFGVRPVIVINAKKLVESF